MRAPVIADIHHVSINVSDVERAEAFYVDVLGLTVLPRPDLGIAGSWLDAGQGRQVHLIESTTIPDDAGQHFAFRVDDIDAECAHLTDQGVELAGPFPVGDARQAFFHDPDHNRLEFNEPA